MFIEEFTEFVSTTLPSHQNNIYIGDFNLHVSEEDTDPAIFNDSIDAMGLYQHVGFPTHKSGNTLDLISKWHMSTHNNNDKSSWTLPHRP